jgi:hypothetical protein
VSELDFSGLSIDPLQMKAMRRWLGENMKELDSRRQEGVLIFLISSDWITTIVASGRKEHSFEGDNIRVTLTLG